MGVDARMLVKLAAPISDDALSDACYRLAEACGKYDVFWLSDDDDLQRGERRRALNRCTADDAYRWYGVAEPDGLWLFVSLWGRYYGPSYERGDLWSFIAIAEWCERNLPGCFVFYGGDSGGTLEPFNRQARERFIAHWAAKGGRPYYAGEGRTYPAWYGGEHPLRPACPLCERPATQYGSGQQFASWSCDGCSRHWVWVGGETVKAFKPSRDFDSFIAAKEMRESPPSADAVDPQVSSTGTPSPREKELEEKIQSLCRALEGRPLQRDQALRNRVSAMAESWGLKDSLDPQMVRRVLRLLLQMPADEALQLCVCGYTYDSHEFGPEGTRTAGLSRVEAGDWHHFEWAAVECPSGSAALEGRPREITGETSDGYHTFNELYAYRKVYHALLSNEWAARGLYDVHKSWRHSDGELCFGGGWFIVVAETPQGQVSNHYETPDWELFQVPERERGNPYDGHTPQMALQRLLELAALPPAPAPQEQE